MVRARRVFINGRSIRHCRKLAKERYPEYAVTKINLSPKKPPRRVLIRGYTKRCRVWLKKR